MAVVWVVVVVVVLAVMGRQAQGSGVDVILPKVRCDAVCGVAGAPLPTEIRLISQELPKNEDVHLLCCWDVLGPCAW